MSVTTCDGGQITNVPLVTDAASLTNSISNDIKICALNKKRGDSLDVEVEIEAEPKPNMVSKWSPSDPF